MSGVCLPDVLSLFVKYSKPGSMGKYYRTRFFYVRSGEAAEGRSGGVNGIMGPGLCCGLCAGASS